MADLLIATTLPAPGDLVRKFKDLGDGSWAEYVALEPESIGGGGSTTIGTVDQGDAGVDPWLVSVSNFPAFPAVQPVSDNGGSLTVDGTVGIAGSVAVTGTFWQATQPVSGTFWQATQPVSGPLTDTQLRAVPVPVSGPLTDTQLRATPLPVSGTVTVQDGGGSITVDGTFWQATQPVSGTVSVSNSFALDATLTGGTQKTKLIDTGGTNVASVSAAGALKVDGSSVTQPVSGTFWQATQPVSGTFWQATQPVSGTFWQATQPISAAALPLPTGAATDAVLTGGTAKVRITDGVDDATVTPLRTLPATTEKTLVVREIPNRLSTFAATIATQTPAITIGVKELLALWHDSTKTKDIYIVEIWASALVTTASTAGRTAIRVSTITTAPTGGTAVGVDVVQGGTTDMTNVMQVKTGGGTIGTTFIRKLAEFTTNPVGRIDIPVFAASNPGNGIILPQGSNTGISIDIEREVAHTALVDVWTVGCRWLEI